MKKAPALAVTIAAGVAHLFIPDTVRLLNLAIVFCLWLMITVPIGTWAMKLVRHHNTHTPPKPLTELEQLWQEIDSPATTAHSQAGQRSSNAARRNATRKPGH